VTTSQGSFYQRRGKRFFDLVAAIVAIVVLSPLAAALALLVKKNLGSPVLFTQGRPGRNGVLFEMRKFRSMLDATDSSGTALPDDERLTPFGSRLRGTSLDELPEFINVLRGDMSLVGPRPLLQDYLGLYSPRQMRRHEVRPGITGWAQVNGRNNLEWDEKFELDVWYVENVTFALDLKILIRTISQVLQRDGISQDGHVTSEAFQGSAVGDET